MYHYRHSHLFMPFTLLLIGLIIGHRFPGGELIQMGLWFFGLEFYMKTVVRWDIFFVEIVTFFFSITLWLAMMVNWVFEQGYQTEFRVFDVGTPKPDTFHDRTPVTALQQIPVKPVEQVIGEPGSGMGEFIFADRSPKVQQVQPKKKDGGIFSQVSDMPRFDVERSFAISMSRCLEGGFSPDFRQERWVDSGKFVRLPFVKMLKNWELNKVIARKSEARNATYIVIDEPRLRRIANGEPLPLHPQLNDFFK